MPKLQAHYIDLIKRKTSVIGQVGIDDIPEQLADDRQRALHTANVLDSRNVIPTNLGLQTFFNPIATTQPTADILVQDILNFTDRLGGQHQIRLNPYNFELISNATTKTVSRGIPTGDRLVGFAVDNGQNIAITTTEAELQQETGILPFAVTGGSLLQATQFNPAVTPDRHVKSFARQADGTTLRYADLDVYIDTFQRLPDFLVNQVSLIADNAGDIIYTRDIPQGIYYGQTSDAQTNKLYNPYYYGSLLELNDTYAAGRGNLILYELPTNLPANTRLEIVHNSIVVAQYVTQQANETVQVANFTLLNTSYELHEFDGMLRVRLAGSFTGASLTVSLRAVDNQYPDFNTDAQLGATLGDAIVDSIYNNTVTTFAVQFPELPVNAYVTLQDYKFTLTPYNYPVGTFDATIAGQWGYTVLPTHSGQDLAVSVDTVDNAPAQSIERVPVFEVVTHYYDVTNEVRIADTDWVYTNFFKSQTADLIVFYIGSPSENDKLLGALSRTLSSNLIQFPQTNMFISPFSYSRVFYDAVGKPEYAASNKPIYTYRHAVMRTELTERLIDNYHVAISVSHILGFVTTEQVYLRTIVGQIAITVDTRRNETQFFGTVELYCSGNLPLQLQNILRELYVKRNWFWAIINQDLYLYQQGFGGIYRINHIDASIDTLTPTFLNMPFIKGISSAAGRLLAWDSDNTIYRSSIFNPVDFEPALATQATAHKIEALRGEIRNIVSFGTAYAVYATGSIHVALFNSRTSEFNYVTHTVEAGIYAPESVDKLKENMQIAFTNTGLFLVTPDKMQPLDKQFSDVSLGAKQPVRVKCFQERYIYLQSADISAAAQVTFTQYYSRGVIV